MTTRRSGFTLIELLVVVAIISIIAAIGFVAYSGYVEAAKKKTAENAMMQLSLAQTEYYSENSIVFSELVQEQVQIVLQHLQRLMLQKQH